MQEITDRVDSSVSTVSPTTAIEQIERTATIAVSGFGSVGYPKGIPEAIAKSDRPFDLTIISGGSVGREIDSQLIDSGAIDRRFPYQAQPESRDAINDGQVWFHDRHVSRLSDEVAFDQLGSIDLAIVEAIAVGDGWFVPSMAIGPTPSYVERAERLIVEVNIAQPLSLQAFHDIYRLEAPPNRGPIPLTNPGGRIGGPRIEFDQDKLGAVIRTDQPGTPYEFRDPTDTDLTIARNLRAFLESEFVTNPALSERLTLQFGVGSLGNALMGAIGSVDVGDREIVYFGEVIQDGLLDLIDTDTLQTASAASLALSREGRDHLLSNVARYRDSIVLRPSCLSNGPELINRFGVIGINSALEVDLYGHANSTHLGGTHIVNGIGGSGDFCRNSLIGIIALHSTAKDGSISRIVPKVPHVDHTEHDFSVVVTEHGVADLRGLDPRERADVLIENCASPTYQPQLRSYLAEASMHGGHMPHDLDWAYSWLSND